MKYVYMNDITGKMKCHVLKRNKALAKLQRDAVIIAKINDNIFIAECEYTEKEKVALERYTA